MACLHPILIKNRRYWKQPEDYSVSQLLLHPEDVVRQTLLVPCGHCAECLKQERNDWYVRLNREFEYQRSVKNQSWFLTLTIDPSNYSAALESPSDFIRGFFEKIRHSFGKSVKHALFQEFSPAKGRLHFHGVLFGCGLSYRAIHEAARGFGFVWIRPVNTRSLRYVVKYIVKDIDVCAKDGRLLDKKYRRKFVSAGVGKFLGHFPPPSFEQRKWDFRDPVSGCVYSYRIPRYYDRYISEAEQRKRSTYSAFLVSQAVGTAFTSRVVLEALQEAFGDEWRKHATSEALRKFAWARSIIDGYRLVYSSVNPSEDTLYGLTRDDILSSFENNSTS